MFAHTKLLVARVEASVSQREKMTVIWDLTSKLWTALHLNVGRYDRGKKLYRNINVVLDIRRYYITWCHQGQVNSHQNHPKASFFYSNGAV